MIESYSIGKTLRAHDISPGTVCLVRLHGLGRNDTFLVNFMGMFTSHDLEDIGTLVESKKISQMTDNDSYVFQLMEDNDKRIINLKKEKGSVNRLLWGFFFTSFREVKDLKIK